MKTLSISSVCLVGALMLGLFVAWGATAPQIITGEQIAGGGCPCDFAPQGTCKSLQGETCNSVAYRCQEPAGDKTCTLKSSHSDCMSPNNGCENWWHQSCD